MSLRPIYEKLKGKVVCFAFSLIRLHERNSWRNPHQSLLCGYRLFGNDISHKDRSDQFQELTRTVVRIVCPRYLQLPTARWSAQSTQTSPDYFPGGRGLKKSYPRQQPKPEHNLHLPLLHCR